MSESLTIPVLYQVSIHDTVQSVTASSLSSRSWKARSGRTGCDLCHVDQEVEIAGSILFAPADRAEYPHIARPVSGSDSAHALPNGREGDRPHVAPGVAPPAFSASPEHSGTRLTGFEPVTFGFVARSGRSAGLRGARFQAVTSKPSHWSNLS